MPILLSDGYATERDPMEIALDAMGDAPVRLSRVRIDARAVGGTGEVVWKRTRTWRDESGRASVEGICFTAPFQSGADTTALYDIALPSMTFTRDTRESIEFAPDADSPGWSSVGSGVLQFFFSINCVSGNSISIDLSFSRGYLTVTWWPLLGDAATETTLATATQQGGFLYEQ